MHMCIQRLSDSAAGGPPREGADVRWRPDGTLSRDPFGLIMDELRDAAQSARASGAVEAGTQLHAAARNVAVARRLLGGPGGQVLQDGGGPVPEPVRLWNGDPTGVALVAVGDGPEARRVAAGDADTALLPPCVPARDLAWELLSSEAARAFAADTVSAALLARALARTCWVAPGTRCRWSTSTAGAVTAVRLMRGGEVFPVLDPSGRLIDADSAALAASLGWRPALGS